MVEENWPHVCHSLHMAGVVLHGKHCGYAMSLEVLIDMLMILEHQKFQMDLPFLVLFLDYGLFLYSLCPTRLCHLS